MSLTPQAPIPALSKQQLGNLVKDYFKKQNATDQQLAVQMRSELVRVIFVILINLSYALFAIGLVFSIKVGLDDIQRLVTFLSTPGREVFFAVLVLIALVIFSIAQVFAKSKTLSPRAKRDLDFVVDALRGSLYICVVVFFEPFAFSDPEEALIIAAFWALLLAAILFAIRKVMKWIFFFVQEKDNFTHWEEFTITSPLQLAQFQQFLLQTLTQSALPPQPQLQPEASIVVSSTQMPSKLASLDDRIDHPQKEEEIK